MIRISDCLSLEAGNEGKLLVWLDTPGRSVNVLNGEMLSSLEAAVQHIENHAADIRLVVIQSRKRDCFFVGADVHTIAQMDSELEVDGVIQRGQKLMSRIEALPMPTVAAISGTCLGGGLELALACRYRIALQSTKTKLGLPEIKLGLIPGWGGTQRLPFAVGNQTALKMILTGKTLNASKSLKSGLVDRVFELEDWQPGLDAFCAELVSGKTPARPAKSFIQRLLEDNWLGRHLVFRFAKKQIASQSKHYPALNEAIELVRRSMDSHGRDFDAERAAFCKLIGTSTAQSLLGLFVQRDRAKKVTTWCPSSESDPPATQRIVVVGAGAMGAGIGALAAAKGYCVVFREIHEAALESGRARVNQLLQSQADYGHMSSVELQAARSRIAYTTRWEDAADCDLAIEAVLEIEAVKREIFEELDRSLPAHAVLTSNTSSLCVTRMAAATRRRNQVAGLHFFNPVDRMELVEIVRTEGTDDTTLRKLLQFVQSLGKTPIVTADKPGFVVNRVLFPYLGEAVRMVAEGYDILEIDRQLRRFGMPMGPLELIDQVGVDIASHVAHSLSAIQADAQVPASVLAHMVDRGWIGKKSGMGFYRHTKNSRKRHVNTALEKGDTITASEPSFAEDGMTAIQRRLVYPMLNEAVHCLDELVVSEAWMVDLAMVLGTGFAPMHGGPLRLIDALGAACVWQNMQLLADTHGARFTPADGLVRAARRSEKFLALNSSTPTWEKDNEPRYPTHS